jgi:hypothetical protein
MKIKVILYGEEQELKKDHDGNYWFLVANDIEKSLNKLTK